MPTEIELLDYVIGRLEKAQGLLRRRRFWQASQEKRDSKARTILTNLLNDTSLPSNMRPFINSVLDIGVHSTQVNRGAAGPGLEGLMNEMNRNSALMALTSALLFAQTEKNLVSIRKS
jgi:hypothetical protein